ncbi:hypothetical protein DJ021_02250 [Phenylobacterium hankyongense]|uniref:Transporter n=1 Tax=Phenylobacterium hankyongense TaxID=1813876 RepID=A0A328AUK1_9CAUL|nr:hypothetical protein [Phenylobacterium hankyongense]RAK58703.1 hypothetical protein DJ021_02250 [Phenylobacterium hankyongense]
MKPAILVLLLAALVAGPAKAQPLTREELVAALKAQERVIGALEQRIAALERERAAAPPIQQIPAPAPTSMAAAGTVAPADDEAALEALSRTLVQRGGLVLPPWRMELIPSFAYSNREVQGLALAATPEGVPTVADQRLRSDQLRASAALRVGLPWSSQAEVRVPYAWLRQSRALGDGSHAVNEGSGLGDVELALSHQFLREAGWRPDLVGGLSWRFATGRDPFRARLAAVQPGSGVDEVRARVTAVKSSDPMVFFGTLSFAHALTAHESFGDVQLGDAVGLELGTLLAVSPETSLTVGLAQEFRGRTQIDRVGSPGSDTAAASLQLGLDRVLAPNVLLDVSLGVGLTRDAPDYAVQVSLPIRFR